MKTTPTENPQEEDAERKVKSDVASRAAEQLPIEMVDLLAKPAWL